MAGAPIHLDLPVGAGPGGQLEIELAAGIGAAQGNGGATRGHQLDGGIGHRRSCGKAAGQSKAGACCARACARAGTRVCPAEGTQGFKGGLDGVGGSRWEMGAGQQGGAGQEHRGAS